MNNNATSPLSPFSFELPTTIRYGKGAAKSLPNELADAGHARLLLISDAGISALPFYASLCEGLEAAGLEFEVFDKVEANPKDRDVEAAADAALGFGADALLALGGGSPMDCAKAAAVVAAGAMPAGEGRRDLQARTGVRYYEGGANLPAHPLPLYTVPTTAGTGSEITFSAVITDSAEKFKFTVKSPRIAPRAAYVDPELTMSMPPELTAATGLDALTHAVEAYTASNAEVISDAAALHAVELISAHLAEAVRDGTNEEARAGMLAGSLLAGIAFSHADVASVHCLAESLGGLYDLPHGLCNAIALPAVMEYNLDYATERYARLADALAAPLREGGAAGKRSRAEAAVERVRSLVAESGLPGFAGLGVAEEDFPRIAEMSERNGSNASNPRPMRKEDYLELLRRLSGRGD